MRRLADVESVLGTRPNTGLRSRVDEMGRSLGALGDTQAKLARDTKALEGKVGSGQEMPQELIGRLTKLEDMLGAMPSGDPAGQSPQLAALAGRLAELQKARATPARRHGRASPVSTASCPPSGPRPAASPSASTASRARSRSGSREPPRPPTWARSPPSSPRWSGSCRPSSPSEADRSANASRIVLTLELANLKRAIDRGERYADELARAKKVGRHAQLHGAGALHAGGRAGAGRAGKIVPQGGQRHARCGGRAAPMPRSSTGCCRARARSCACARPGHAADDTSAEAVIGRMEAALKDGRLAEVLANAKTLPPKAALAGEDWVKKVEARQAVEQALADVEAALKASLGPGPPAGTDGRR